MSGAGKRIAQAGVEKNPLSRIEQLESEVADLRAMVLNVTRMDSLTSDAGSVTRGEWRIKNSADTLRLLLSAMDMYEEMGVHAHLAALSALGAPTAWIDADNGEITGGGGDVTLGDGGVVLRDHVPLELRQNNSFIGSLYSSFLFCEGTNGSVVLISNAARGNTNKIVDGDFESGGLSNWDVTYAPGAAITTSDVHEGSYALRVTEAAVPYQVVYSAARFAVTAGNKYLFMIYTRRAIGADFLVEVQYYNAASGGSLLATDRVLREDRETATWQRSIGLPSVAPAGATHARLRIEMDANSDISIDDIVFVDASSMIWIRGGTSGWEVHGGLSVDGAPVTGAQRLVYAKGEKTDISTSGETTVVTVTIPAAFLDTGHVIVETQDFFNLSGTNRTLTRRAKLNGGTELTQSQSLITAVDVYNWNSRFTLMKTGTDAQHLVWQSVANASVAVEVDVSAVDDASEITLVITYQLSGAVTYGWFACVKAWLVEDVS